MAVFLHKSIKVQEHLLKYHLHHIFWYFLISRAEVKSRPGLFSCSNIEKITHVLGLFSAQLCFFFLTQLNIIIKTLIMFWLPEVDSVWKSMEPADREHFPDIFNHSSLSIVKFWIVSGGQRVHVGIGPSRSLWRIQCSRCSVIQIRYERDDPEISLLPSACNLPII